jgi:hypothetical protein
MRNVRIAKKETGDVSHSMAVHLVDTWQDCTDQYKFEYIGIITTSKIQTFLISSLNNSQKQKSGIDSESHLYNL